MPPPPGPGIGELLLRWCYYAPPPGPGIGELLLRWYYYPPPALELGNYY